jgi:hypothetical protein
MRHSKNLGKNSCLTPEIVLCYTPHGVLSVKSAITSQANGTYRQSRAHRRKPRSPLTGRERTRTSRPGQSSHQPVGPLLEAIRLSSNGGSALQGLPAGEARATSKEAAPTNSSAAQAHVEQITPQAVGKRSDVAGEGCDVSLRRGVEGRGGAHEEAGLRSHVPAGLKGCKGKRCRVVPSARRYPAGHASGVEVGKRQSR